MHLKIEEKWSDGGVFIAILEMKVKPNNVEQKLSRVFTLQDCFTKEEASRLILKNFPDIRRIAYIEYFENCHILKSS